jgi:hypothetical protein
MIEKAIDTIFKGIQKNFVGVEYDIIRKGELNDAHLGLAVKIYSTGDTGVIKHYYAGNYVLHESNEDPNPQNLTLHFLFYPDDHLVVL